MKTQSVSDNSACPLAAAAHIALRCLVVVPLLTAALPRLVHAQDDTVQLNQNCTVSILNRNIQVSADGSWILPDVPANLGPVRARATCVQNGVTVSGQSDLFALPADGIVNLPPIQLGNTTPIPNSLAVSAPSTTLTAVNQTVQLSVIATMSDGTSPDYTAASTGTLYKLSNPALATVSADGLVTALGAGTVLIQAANEGTQGLLLLHLVFGATTPSGIPVAWAIANGLDPNDPNLANEDPDHDALTNLQEYQLGTDPNNPDTDGDGLGDGDEVMIYHTNPLAADTDGDGIPDGVEIQTGTDPNDPKSYSLAKAVATLDVKPANFLLAVSSISGIASQQLQVLGHLIDGKTIADLTSIAKWGTNYLSSDLTVCNFGAPDGNIFAGNGGSCTITVTIPGHSATALGTVTGFSPKAVSSLSVPGYANHVELSGNYAYIAAGAAGLQVVDISNRLTPSIVASLALPGNADGLKVVGRNVFVAAGTAGLHVVDISSPLAPVLTSSFNSGDEVRDLQVTGGIAYLANGNSGVMAIGVANPATPVMLGSVALPGFTKGVAVDGVRKLLVAVGSMGLSTVDIATPGSPALLGSINWNGDMRAVTVMGGFAFVADIDYSLTSVDITNPASPIFGESLYLTQGGRLRDLTITGNLELGADVYFGTGAPIVNVSAPLAMGYLQTLFFSPNRNPYVAGTGIVADPAYLYLTASDDWITEKGATGNTVLYIGQYAPFPIDTLGVPPTVSIVAPSGGGNVLAGAQIPIMVNATDDVAVAAVSVLVNGQVVNTQTVATGACTPCQFPYSVPVGAGSLTIGAQATDFGGNAGTAQPVTVTVLPNTVPPVVSIAAPVSGLSIVQGSGLPISVTATDNAAISQVTILVNGQPVFTTSTPPYGFVYTAPAGVTTLTISARATDPSGNVGTAQPVTVTATPDTIPPTVAVLSPANGIAVSQRDSLQISLDAVDNVAVSQVTVLINGQPAFTATAPPYQFTYSIPPGVTSLIVGARAVDPSGNVGLAQPAAVSVFPGIVTIMSPADGSTVPQGGAIPIEVFAASDRIVSLLVNGQTVVDRSLPPIEYTLAGPFNASTLTIVAQATYYQPPTPEFRAHDDTPGQVATAQVKVTVIPGPSTSAQGVVNSGGVPYAGATVVCQGKTAVSGGDGSFTIAGLDSAVGPIACVATATVGGVKTGSSAAVAPVAGGVTNVGTLTLSSVSSRGREFWLVNASYQVPGSSEGANPGVLYLVSATAANYTVSNASLNYSVTGTVTPGSPAAVTLPSNLTTGTQGQTVESLGIHVTADADIGVFLAAMNSWNQVDVDMLLGIPAASLGTEYFALSYPDPDGFNVLTVVASQDGTNVTISNACNFFDAVALDRGQTYNLQCGDVSGAHIVSDKPIGVFASAPAGLPVPGAGDNHGYFSQMMFPIGTAWGREFYGSPTNLQSSYVFRVTAAVDGTTVTADLGGGNTQTVQLDHGGVQEFDFPGTGFTGVHFTGNQPILAVHLGAGQPGGSNNGPQPFAMQLLPVASAGTSFSFYAPPAPPPQPYSTMTYANSVLIVAPNAAVGSVQLNGTLVPASSFSALPGGAYQYAQVPVPDGGNVVTSTQPAMVYTLGSSIASAQWYRSTYAAPARF